MDYELITDANGVEHIIVSSGDGFTSMPKLVWDELGAAKENGTIS